MAELLRGGVTTVMEIGGLGRVRGRARAPTTASACTWARPSAPGAGSRGTASAWSGSGTRSRGGGPARARWTSTRSTTAPTAASCAASSRPPRSTPARPRCSRKRSASRTRRACRTRCTPSQSVVEFNEMVARHGKTPIAWMRELGVLGPNTILGHAIIIGGSSWTNYPAGDVRDHGGRGLLGRPRGVGVRAAGRGHGVVRALPRRRRQHVARHRHQSAERDRGDAVGRGVLEDRGAQHRGHHRRARLRRGHPRRGAGARARRPRAHRAGGARPTSCCGGRPRGG